MVVAGQPGNDGYTPNGPAHLAQFDYPRGIAIDQDDNLIIADYGNHCVRKLSSDGKTVVLLAGSPGTCGSVDGDALLEAQFNYPRDIAINTTLIMFSFFFLLGFISGIADGC